MIAPVMPRRDLTATQANATGRPLHRGAVRERTDENKVVLIGGLQTTRCLLGVTDHARKLLKALVGAAGFEPAAPCSQSRCATRLRHAPTPGWFRSLSHRTGLRPE